ncbi:MAG: 1-acyl-sn-glycerol-3-phosphate acyltransferase [Bacteroidales bacterium]|nr:1-acyl-sn-glycerol-3-phosphate acyltransferase [Bacteroidales bacterium]MCF8390334.1 1-acyl-sn-glycerol-3-phosphate acyltransferase [Bacteroidales bacterium]
MSLKKENIHHNNYLYNFLKAYEQFAFRRFYKHMEAIGKENIPIGSPYIFAPNHQNALMDPLAVLATHSTPVIFFARADVFKKKWIAKILHIFKIKPIYRMRDGAAELHKNEGIFQAAVSVLQENAPMCVMAEGNHGDKRQLRKLVKGIFRIAFRTQELVPEGEGVKIVPVGLDYSEYTKFFQNLLVIYGPPIEVSEYIEAYKEDAPKGINALRERLATEMKKVMIHIQNDELYDMYQYLRELYNDRMRIKLSIVGKSLYEKFRADKQMIRILDEEFEVNPDKLRALSEKTLNYKAGLEKLNLRNWIFDRSGYTTKRLIYKRLGLYLSFPLFLLGYINNIIPYSLPLLTIPKIKDAQFHSSFKFALAFILFPVFYTLQAVLVGIFSGTWWIGLAYLIALPLFGYFALFWHIWHKRWRAGLKYRKLKKSRNKELLDLEKLHKEIVDTMNTIVSARI